MFAVQPGETGNTCTSKSSSWIVSISDGTGFSVPESHPHVIDIVPIADSDEETDIHLHFGNQVEESDTRKSKLSQVNFDLAVIKTTVNESNDKPQVKATSALEAVNVMQPDAGHSKNSLIEILDTETEVVEIFPEAENNMVDIAPVSINAKAAQHNAVSKSYIVQPGSYDLDVEDIDMSLEPSPCVQKSSENCECDRTGEQNTGESSGKCESLLPRLQGNARGGGRLSGGCSQPGQKLEKALNFLKKGVNVGLRKSVAENANGSVLRSCLAGLPSASLPGREVDAGETIEGSSTTSGVSISSDKCVENTGVCGIASTACIATNSSISGCVQGSGKSATALTSATELRVTGQVSRRKRKNPHSSVELCAGISQIPLHVKEEQLDDGYEEVSGSSKVVVLESSIGSDVPAGSGQSVSSTRGVQGEPVVSVLLAAGVSGKQRTMPSYRFTNFKVTAATPRTIAVPSVVRPIRYSAPCMLTGGSQSAVSNPRGKLNVLLRSPPSVAQSQMLPAAANTIVSKRIQPRILPQTVPSFISSKPSSSTSSQSPVVILVNKRPPGANSVNSNAVGSVLQCNQPSSLSVILSPSSASSGVTGGKTARLVKACSESSMTLSRKFQMLYKKSVLSKLVSPKLMPESLYVSDLIKPLACTACGDEFVTEAGLNDHYDRKSIAINFTCRCNKKTNVFYNMCSFARFYDEHRSQETRLQFYRQHTGHESCSVALIPNSLLPSECQTGEKEKPAETEAAVVAPVLSIPSPPAPAVTAAVKENDSSIPTLNEFFKALDRHNCACLECNAEYKRRRGLSSHFSGQRGLASGLRFQCEKCFMVLPNVCSFKSHSRIHNRLEPYVCPECGQIFRTSREVFMKHVKQVCLHFSRFQSRQCPICAVTLSHSLESMIAHLEHVHTQSYHKCSACTMAFPTVKSFRCHTVAQHGGDAVSKTIHKCPFCKVAQMDQKSLIEHIAQHVNDVGFGKPRDFRCLHCSTNFVARTELVEHMKSTHPTDIITGAMCEICGFVCDNTLSLYGHINTEHSAFFKQLFEKKACNPPSALNSPKVNDHTQVKASPSATSSKEQSSRSPAKSFECDRCQMVLDDGEKYERHMAKHRYMESKRGSSKTPPSSGKEKRRRIKGTRTVEEKHSEIKSEDWESKDISASGEVKSVANSKTLSNAVKKLDGPHLGDSDLSLYWFSCHLCEKTFRNSEDLQQHLKETHSGKSRQHAYLCWICREQSELKSYPKAGMLIKHLKHFHKIARKNIDYGRIALSNGKDDAGTEDDVKPLQPSTSVRKLRVEGESTYNCAKCEFSCSERAPFLEHIKCHCRENSHQCPECGVCFVVLPSLKRHLIIVHRVRDFDRYFTETGFSLEVPTSCDVESDPEDFPVVPSVERSNEDLVSSPEKESSLECTVCYRTFGDECAVRQHMRVHGMAFIQGTRRSNMSRRSVSSDG